ncbi:MAG: RING finger protein [Candidatus Kariarchaeaceae archaeon]
MNQSKSVSAINLLETLKKPTGATDDQLEAILGSLLLSREVNISKIAATLDLPFDDVVFILEKGEEQNLFSGRFLRTKYVVEKYKCAVLMDNAYIPQEGLDILGYLSGRRNMDISEIGSLFKYTKEEVLQTLYYFVTHGYLSGRLKKSKLEVLQVVPPSSLTTRSDAQIALDRSIIGYCILRKRVPLDELVKRFDITHIRLFRDVFGYFLRDLVRGSIDVSKKVLRTPEVLIKLTSLKDLEETPTFDAISSREKLVCGVIQMRKIISLSQISKIISINKEELIEILSYFSLTRFLLVQLTEKEEVHLVADRRITSTRSLSDLKSLSIFNYGALVGILKTTPNITIKKISQKMRQPPVEVILGLTTLINEKIIQGRMTPDQYFFTQTIKAQAGVSSGQGLSEWEQILFGMLISQEKASVTELAELLKISKAKALEHCYEFLSKGVIKGQLLNEKDLLLHELPRAPPLNQVEDLDLLYREIRGYIIMNGSVKTKDLLTIWNLKHKDFMLILFKLVGSGMITGMINNKEIIYEEHPKATPTINLRDIDPFYTVLSNFLEQNGTALSVKDLSRRLNKDQRLIIKALSLFVSDGYYPLGRMRKNRFYKGGPLMKIRGKPKCYHCGTEVENPDLPCPSCNKASPKCAVCRGALVTTDNIVSCPHCKHMAHRDHILNWLNIRSSCPLCKGQLSERTLVVHN